mgnify:CR=1 FL=1
MEKSNVFSNDEIIRCTVCGKDLNRRYKNVYGTNNNWWEWWNSKGYSLLQGKMRSELFLVVFSIKAVWD